MRHFLMNGLIAASIGVMSVAPASAFPAALAGVEPPPEQPFETADLSPMARTFYADNRKVRARRIRDELGVRLLHPTYRDGLRAILQDSGPAGQ